MSPNLWAQSCENGQLVCVQYEQIGETLMVSAQNHSIRAVSLSVSVNQQVIQNGHQATFEIAPQTSTTLGQYTIDHGNGQTLKISSQWVYGRLNTPHEHQYLYALPYKRNTRATVSQTCQGQLSHHDSNALDFAMPEGTEFFAIRDGVVIEVIEHFYQNGNTRAYADFSNLVRVEHNDGSISSYYHLQQYGVLVEVGQRVSQGDLLGYSGNTGFSTGPHLHVEVNKSTGFNHIESIAVQFKTSSGIAYCPAKGSKLAGS